MKSLKFTGKGWNTSSSPWRSISYLMSSSEESLFLDKFLGSRLTHNVYMYIITTCLPFTQGLFLDTFPPNQLNSSWRFSSFFWNLARVFSRFCSCFEFFHQKYPEFFGNGIYSMEYIILISKKE